ncbi:hypothetical protein [Nostoc sp.]|uniref:hypothetical protein n=1 Tax=Nostoc sp. TaxID=1180 RepID=UPI002FF6D42C
MSRQIGDDDARAIAFCQRIIAFTVSNKKLLNYAQVGDFLNKQYFRRILPVF